MGPFMTSLGMHGLSVTLLRGADKGVLALLDAPTEVRGQVSRLFSIVFDMYDAITPLARFGRTLCCLGRAQGRSGGPPEAAPHTPACPLVSGMLLIAPWRQ